MRIEGSSVFQAPVAKVWEVFTDPDVLARCTPGCEGLQHVGEETYETRITIGVAAIKGTYTGKLQLAEKEPPTSYKLLLEGSGSPGFVQGSGSFRFEPKGEDTCVTYAWDVQVGGLVAGVGQRVLGGVGKLLIGQFFKSMERELEVTR